jgi:hypothetical protein
LLARFFHFRFYEFVDLQPSKVRKTTFKIERLLLLLLLLLLLGK